MPTTELLPTEHACAPNGVLHRITQHPDIATTFCGVLTGKKWAFGNEAVGVAEVTHTVCIICRKIEKFRYAGGDDLGNFAAQEGLDRCPCGCKYWEHDTCIDCGTAWHPSFRDADDV